MNKSLLKATLVAFLALFLFAACSKIDRPIVKTADNYDGKTLHQWLDLQFKLIKTTPGFAPPVAARALAYTNLAVYESIAYGSSGNRSIANQLNGMPSLISLSYFDSYNWEFTAAVVMHELLPKFYSNTSIANLNSIDSLFNVIKNSAASSTDLNNLQISENYGRHVARQIFEWSTTDGGYNSQFNNFPDYVLPVGPEFWLPTSTTNLKPLLPYWGQNRLFLSSNNSIAIPAPLVFSTLNNSDEYQQHLEVYNTSNNLTAEQRNIALFWADGGGTLTPGGHSFSIAKQIAGSKNFNLIKSAELYTKIGLAVSDAFVCCWKTKYTYNTLRPVTYIKNYINPGWVPLINTPPFPEHCSGHSTQSGAASEVLSGVFGSMPFVDHTHDAIGFSPRSFTSFDDFGTEAMNSRLYGGIHIRRGNESGLQMGKLIGRNILQLRFNR